MSSLSIWHWIVVIVVVMLLFGRGSLAALLDDLRRPFSDRMTRRGPPVRAPSRGDWYWPVVIAIGLLLLGFLLWQWSGWRS